jgi:hypothetical protein
MRHFISAIEDLPSLNNNYSPSTIQMIGLNVMRCSIYKFSLLVYNSDSFQRKMEAKGRSNQQRELPNIVGGHT